MVVPGNVLATGGIVAKFVGVTLTTVVATPKVSVPHEEANTDTTTTDVAINAPRRKIVRADVSTDLHSRC